jgi:glycosyltransferase involved in cell wall biosynthesis
MSSAPLRILHTESSLGWGGQEIRVLTEAAGVARRGHHVLLAAPPEARIYAEASRFGVEAIAMPIGRKNVRGVLAVRRLLATRPLDVVNTHSSTDSWLTALAARTVERSPALVRTRHISAPVPRNRATRWLYGTATDHIVTTGERLRAQVVEESGVSASRVVSIPTGIDLERFRPGERLHARRELGLAADAMLVGIVATLRSWKGHRFLLDAFASLERPHLRLAIVGDGPQREALGAQVDRLGIGERVLFAGNRDDVAPWMRAFDVFCLPSYANEGVPQSLMQAMACGVPVITTGVGSIPEIVTDGINGLIVPAQDAQALARAMASLLEDPARRATLGTRALADARERFGEARMVERMIDVFRDAAATRTRHG